MRGSFIAGKYRSRDTRVTTELLIICPEKNLRALTLRRGKHGCMARTEISTDIPVMYFDTDAAGVVHNIVYLRFIEVARTQLAIQMGMSFEEIARTQIHPVVTRTEIDYKRPAMLGDTVRVSGRISEWSGIRFWCEFQIIRPRDEALLVTCRQALALVKMPEGRPVRLPAGFPESFSLAGDR